MLSFLPSRGRAKLYLEFVKFEHTLFALPFAYGGMLLAERRFPGLGTFLLISLAMVSARTASMALNRVIDAQLDALNPRTRDRAIPQKQLRVRDGLWLALGSIALFALAAWALNPLTLALLPVALFFLTLYPYTKRFTWACHYWLGLTIGAAAAAGWIAVTGAFAPAALALWAGVGLWIAGFDILYGVMDYAFDLEHHVHSVPVRFGIATALELSALTHLLAWGFLALAVPLSRSGWPFALGLVVMAGILYYQHRLVAKRGVAQVLRSFNANLYVGVTMLLAIVLDIVLHTS